MAARFSKQTLTYYIQTRIDKLQTDWGFDPRNGYAQIRAVAERRQKASKSAIDRMALQPIIDEANRAYGEFDALRNMADEFGLDVNLTAPEKT